MSNHRTRWTQEETAFLLSEWDGHRETTVVIAELLERTPDATQQRYYEVMWGKDQGVEFKPDETRLASAAYHSVVSKSDDLTPSTPVCPTCNCYLPMTLKCDDCG